MNSLVRSYLIELVATFGLVFFSSGVVIVNHLSTPSDQIAATSTLTSYQPGLVGIALTQGLMLAALLAATLPVSGGYLNPAITLALWVFNRLDTKRAAWFIGAQLLGAALAGYCLGAMIDGTALSTSRMGTPHLSSEAFAGGEVRGNIIAGTTIELLLTFFFVFAIFGVARGGSETGLAALVGGGVLVASAFVAFPITGCATNPARWFGTVIWELRFDFATSPFSDTFVYVAGPIAGALLAGLFYFKVYAVESSSA